MLNLLFISMSLFLFVYFYLGTGKNKHVLWYSIAWVSAISGLAIGGFFENTITMPPRFLVVLIGNIIFVSFTFFQLKKVNISSNFAFGVHAIRLPVEIGLHYLFLAGLVPQIMTFQGWNFDILTGISAGLLLLFTFKNKNSLSRKGLWLWNIMGMCFLAIIYVCNFAGSWCAG